MGQLVELRLGIEGLLVLASPLAESLCCVLEEDTLYTVTLLNAGSTQEDVFRFD